MENSDSLTSTQSSTSADIASPEAAFKDLVSNSASLAALEEMGISTPTTIQSRAIPLISSGSDVFVKTSRGSGKTLCYGLAIAEAIESMAPALVIVEPAPSVDTVAEILSSLKLSVASLASSEGKSAASDAQIVVGTSKMAFEAIGEGALKVDTFKTLVMDGLDIPASAPQIDQVSRTDVEGVLEAFEGKAIARIWLSETIPLALTAVVKKYFQTGTHKEVNDEETDGTEFVEHSYIEVGGDLKAKPNALCDLLEGTPEATCVIFCNSPSDADFIDVILSRRGIASAKLIGHVPPRKVQSAVKGVKDGEIRAIIATDVASRHIPVEDFHWVINHAIHSDPEVYIHRMGRPSADSQLKTVLSLIGPTDVGNFHYLRKLVEFEFTKGALPDDSTILQMKGESLIREALASPAATSDKYKDLVSLLKESSELDKILAFLVHNTLDVMPGLAEASRAGKPRRDRDYSDADRDENDRSGGGRDKSSDGRRGRDRRHGRDEDFEGDDDSPRGRGRRDEPRTPPKKDLRIYLGHGAKDGFSEEVFVGLLKNLEESATATPERFSLRERYAFVDFPSEVGEALMDKLGTLSLEDGTPLTALKATLISAPRETHSQDSDELAPGNGDHSDDAGDDSEDDSREMSSASEMA